MKFAQRIGLMLLFTLGMAGLNACSKQEGGSGEHQITLGFSQIGAESEWRTANTNSIKDAAVAANIK